MPCRDYYPDDYSIRETQRYEEQRNKLARIACRAMAALESIGRLDLVMNEEAQEWFKQHKIDDARAKVRKAEKARQLAEETRLKKSALNKLSPAEKKVLGVK